MAASVLQLNWTRVKINKHSVCLVESNTGQLVVLSVPQTILNGRLLGFEAFLTSSYLWLFTTIGPHETEKIIPCTCSKINLPGVSLL